MSEPGLARSKRPRGSYSRLICLGCRERRIRCELPRDVEIPDPGEHRTIQTPCSRCERLGIACVVRQTILGRPGPERSSTSVVADSRPVGTSNVVSRIVAEPPSQSIVVHNESRPGDGSASIRTGSSPSKYLPSTQQDPPHWKEDLLLIHTPQSSEAAFLSQALDTLRCEHVEEEWFRHLPAHFGRTRALDLSIKAMVVACAYARGVPDFTSRDCYQALALALAAVHAHIEQTRGEPNDDILASTALLAPFEDVIRKNGIPTRLHLRGLAAIIAARPATYPVTPLAREILDFNACESAIMACIQDTASPFEGVARAYFGSMRVGYSDSDQAQLKALGNELFIRVPRLLSLVRKLRDQPCPQHQLLLDAFELSKLLLRLQDSQAEERLLRMVKVQPSKESDATSSLPRSLCFASIKDFEALAYYWQSRLSLLRLEWRLQDLYVPSTVRTNSTDESEISFPPSCGPTANEMFRLAKNVLMCLEYASTSPLFKHQRLLAHAVVVVWGVMMDMPVAFGHDLDGQRQDPLSTLLLRRVNMALAAKPTLTVKDMDMAADMFAGGKSRGRFAELYGS